MDFALELDASMIHVVDLQAWQRRPSIALQSGFSPTSFTCLAFSGNGKFLIAQGGIAESILHYFDVKNGNHLGGTKVTTNPSSGSASNAIVTCISINPNEPASICCTGRGIFRLINKSDKGFIIKQSSMANKDTFDFRSHIWTLDGRTIITALADGRISQLDLSLVRVDINLNNPTGNPVTHLTATQKGFLCATGGTRLHFFERTSEKGWQESNTVQIDEKETITSAAIAQADDRVTILLSDSRLVSVPFSQSDHGQNAEPVVTLLPPHHIGPVSAIDVAFRKQLLVSCGEDHAIRVWNYEKMQCEIAKFFVDQPFSVSFHPNGGCIVVGFTEKLRLMAITINDIVIHREFPIRSCRECRFSHGGQYFAAVNTNNAEVYSSYIFKNLVNLRSPGQRIKAIAW
jgi:WD40 repeat protein